MSLKKNHKHTNESWVSLLFYFDVSSQNGGDFSLHESPGHVGADQRALLAAGTVHLAGGTLLLNALPGAGEAELVRRHRRALDEVGVLQAFVAYGAAERHAVGHRRVWNVGRVNRLHAWVWGAHRRRHVPVTQSPLAQRRRRQGATTVAAGGRVHLAGLLGRMHAARVVRHQDQGRHGRLSVLPGVRRRRVRRRRRGVRHRGHLQAIGRQR